MSLENHRVAIRPPAAMSAALWPSVSPTSAPRSSSPHALLPPPSMSATRYATEGTRRPTPSRAT